VCPAAEDSSSAKFTLAAFDRLRAEPSLRNRKRDLKLLVVGEEGTTGYRKPNDEIEVLLALQEADELTCCAAVV
jgi:hypothetical protein